MLKEIALDDGSITLYTVKRNAKRYIRAVAVQAIVYMHCKNKMLKEPLRQ